MQVGSTFGGYPPTPRGLGGPPFFVLLVVKFMSLQTAVVHRVLLEKLHGDRIDVDHDGDNIKKTFIHFAWRQFVLVISSQTQWFVFGLHVFSMVITRWK